MDDPNFIIIIFLKQNDPNLFNFIKQKQVSNR